MTPSELPWVTACVPAYRSAAFVGKTLESLEAQTHPNLRIVVSVDLSDDDTEGACRAFRGSRPIEVIAQPCRRGWVGNTNAALDRVESELFFICPHDDLVLPDYVSTLQQLLSGRADAISAYCDVQTFGKVEEIRSVTDLDGKLADRLASLVSQRREGVPWRGLTRSLVLEQGLRMRDNPHSGFHSHVAWLVELLLKGPLLHHPEALYLRHERSDEHSVVTGWLAWTAEERAAAVAESTRQCLEIAAGAPLNAADWDRVRDAILTRFRRIRPKLPPAARAEGRIRLDVEDRLRQAADRARNRS